MKQSEFPESERLEYNPKEVMDDVETYLGNLSNLGEYVGVPDEFNSQQEYDEHLETLAERTLGLMRGDAHLSLDIISHEWFDENTHERDKIELLYDLEDAKESYTHSDVLISDREERRRAKEVLDKQYEQIRSELI
jgi:hypothetical protein